MHLEQACYLQSVLLHFTYLLYLLVFVFSYYDRVADVTRDGILVLVDHSDTTDTFCTGLVPDACCALLY